MIIKDSNKKILIEIIRTLILYMVIKVKAPTMMSGLLGLWDILYNIR